MMEFKEQDSDFFNEMLDFIKRYPNCEFLQLKNDSVLSFQQFEIDFNHRKVYCDKQEINLTAKEYDILCLLAANRGHVLTYDQIYQKVWGEEAFGNVNNAIACHVHNLREKIGRLLPEGCFVIRCVWEVGYCFETDTNCVVAT